MSPLPEERHQRETTDPGFRPAWAVPDSSLTEETRLPLKLVIALGVMLVSGAGSTAVAFFRLADFGSRLDKQEALSIDRGIQGQRTDDKLDRISEDQREMRQDLKELKAELRSAGRGR